MLRYYFLLGLRGLRRSPALTALMVLTLAVGVAASIATLTILHVMSGNPIPHKSNRLIVPLLDNRPMRGYEPGQKSFFEMQISWRDANFIASSNLGARRTALYDVGGAAEPAKPDQPVIDMQGIATTADYFPMFDVPFLHGTAWTASDEQAKARVLVLSQRKAEQLFGQADAVGKRVRAWNQEFTVVGVLGKWEPSPRYTHLINGSGGTFSGQDDVYVPLATAIALQMPNNGSTNCPGQAGPGFQGLLDSECTWLQGWVELGAVADRPALKSSLEAYVADQRRLGRFERPEALRLFDVMEWLDWMEVVDNDHRIAVWLAFGFLLLCMVNTMSLLLAKFSARASEVGVRRALGATQGAIFRQFMVETSVIGLAGGALGLGLAWGALWLIRQQSRDLGTVANLDLPMLAATFAIAVGASVLAGLLPTWRACQVTPALQLKSQ